MKAELSGVSGVAFDVTHNVGSPVPSNMLFVVQSAGKAGAITESKSSANSMDPDGFTDDDFVSRSWFVRFAAETALVFAASKRVERDSNRIETLIESAEARGDILERFFMGHFLSGSGTGSLAVGHLRCFASEAEQSNSWEGRIIQSGKSVFVRVGKVKES
jgi:hypothetical protein